MKSFNIYCCLLLLGAYGHYAAGDSIEFNRDVRPILSNNCFSCHGLDENSREAELRLDVRENALQARDGRAAIVPGKPDESLLIRRIESSVDDERMPPPEAKKTLTAREKDILRRWIAGGAAYEVHWSLIPPRAAKLPTAAQADWPRNPVDRFVLERLEREGLSTSPAAAREILLRRVSLDLTGLPPTLDELDAFLADSRPDAYERAVDRLLASPHFGERMTVDWLDLARYADTNGYFGDKPRSVWPWRDWVIDAFNRNLPFDVFTVEQLAGDLLPNATTSQRIATGFNRNHMANNESGLIDEEYRVEYVADRVETTAATWLGFTVGCARCHDHKFDPISQKEFYQLFAFFNNVVESGLITQDNPPPVLEVPSPELTDKLQELTKARDNAQNAFAGTAAQLDKELIEWEETAAKKLSEPPHDRLLVHVDFNERIAATAVGTTIQYERGILGKAAKFDATQHAELKSSLDLDSAWTISVWLKPDSSLSCLYSQIEPEGRRRGMEVLWQKGRLHIHLVNQWGVKSLELATRDPLPSKRWHHFVISYDGKGKASGLRVFANGHSVAVNIERNTLEGPLANQQPFRIARRDSGLGYYGELDELRILQRTVTDQEVEAWFWGERLRGILATDAAARTGAEKDILLDYYLLHYADAAAREGRQRVQTAQRAIADLRATIPATLVMQELPQPRVTAVLERGQYDHRGETVQPDIPQSLGSWPAAESRNRLGFAKWLVSPGHPLTARVTVNRLWMQCFGEAIVRTVSDFGSQGELPSHPELLDWLAVRFQSDWDVKSLLRLLVTSETYRQQSSASEDLLRRDADNRWYARGPRFRVSAEFVRDQALASSGLLVSRIGGPSVKPFQPAGLWEAVSYNGEETYVADSGEGLWRRSLYTYWKRQSPPPTLLTFDGPTREKCTVRRARTNTPLQALVMLNDETYLQAARDLAVLTLSAAGSDEQRLQRAFRRVTSREPDAEELKILQALLKQQRDRYYGNDEQAKQLVRDSILGWVSDPTTTTIRPGRSPNRRRASPPSHFSDHEPTELAAWIVTVHTLFNLDESITRR